MASQVSHIVYAKRFLDKLESVEITEASFKNETTKKILTHRDEFLLGCVFPDVRVVAENLARKDTHMYFPQVNLDFSGLTPFKCGWKFHVYCDMKREEVLNKHDFYTVTKDIEKSWLANKMFEDELVYDVYNNWEKLVYYFNNIPHVELLDGLSREALELWYSMVSKYISEKPNDRTTHIFVSKIKQPDVQKADMVVEKISRLRKMPLASEILRKVYDEIV